MNKYIYMLAITALLNPAYAGDHEHLFNVFSLQVQQEGEVVNDEMRVVMAVEKVNRDPGILARLVNDDMQWALKEIKNNNALNARTLAYSTYPVYEKQAVVRWRAVQQLEIKGTDIPAINRMIGILQKKLQVKQMQFSSTAATREKVEAALVSKALLAFQDRADLVRKTMSAKSYEVVRVDINSGGQYHPVSFARHKERAMLSSAATMPAVEAGTSKATVTVSGSIRLK